MSALERIKSAQHYFLEADQDGWGGESLSSDEIKLLFKAFHVMHEILFEHSELANSEVDKEFEERMVWLSSRLS